MTRSEWKERLPLSGMNDNQRRLIEEISIKRFWEYSEQAGKRCLDTEVVTRSEVVFIVRDTIRELGRLGAIEWV